MATSKKSYYDYGLIVNSFLDFAMLFPSFAKSNLESVFDFWKPIRAEEEIYAATGNYIGLHGLIRLASGLNPSNIVVRRLSNVSYILEFAWALYRVVVGKNTAAQLRPMLILPFLMFVWGRFDKKNKQKALAAEKAKVVDVSMCLKSVYHSNVRDAPQTFPTNLEEITTEWLSNALQEKVLSFDSRICAEGQISLTVVLTNIKYGGVNKETRPKSLALKLNHQDPGARQFFKEYYDQEVWFYTSENFLQSIPMTIPKALGVWQGSENGVAGLKNLIMMENLNENYIPYDQLNNQPSWADLQMFMQEAAKLHAKFWMDKSCLQKPFTTTPGEHKWSFPASWKHFGGNINQVWENYAPAAWNKMWGGKFGIGPFDTVTKVKGIKGCHPDYLSAINLTEEDFMDGTGDAAVKMYKEIEKIFSSRPFTMMHGDMNSGNLWKSKDPSKPPLFADWQLFRMGTPGIDFFTLFAMVEFETFGPGSDIRLLKFYHQELCRLVPQAKSEYPLQHLIDDVLLTYTPFAFFAWAMSLNLMQPGALPPEKEEFTMKVMWPTAWKRWLRLCNDNKQPQLIRKVLAGEYDNYGPYLKK